MSAAAGAFSIGEDIANRGAQHVGAKRILSFADVSKTAAEMSFCYDKLRLAELRRSVWRFATRRAVLRALTATTERFVPAIYNPATAYTQGQIIRDANGIFWICSIANTGSVPGVPVTGYPAYWQQYFGPVHADAYSSTVTYYAGDLAYISSVWYLCTANGTLDAAPASGSPWVVLPTPTTTITPLLIDPAGPGLLVNTRARNIFPLPNGFMRLAAVDPKIESTATLVTSAAIQYSDWMLEGNRIVSSVAGPIFPFRFVANVSDVTAMDSLFCEALGARMGYEVCEILTQSNVKLQAIAAAYQKFMRDARLVNQLETGSTEEEEDELRLTEGPQGVVDGAGEQQPQQH